jgi:ComF family protein
VRVGETSSGGRPAGGSPRWWARLADVVFPPVCVACGGLVPDGGAFRNVCAACDRDLPRVRPPACGVCGHPFDGVVEGPRTCPHCRRLRPAFREGLTATRFRGAARALVIELKYHHGLHTLGDIETVFRTTPHVRERIVGAVLVPVPLHARKLRERGFNQSECLARALVRAADGQARVERLLIRRIDTKTQTAFDRRRRLANLKNAFALAPGARILRDQHYVLVDDVFTTGSTLNRCARVLRTAGIVTLDVVTFGHG